VEREVRRIRPVLGRSGCVGQRSLQDGRTPASARTAKRPVAFCASKASRGGDRAEPTRRWGTRCARVVRPAAAPPDRRTWTPRGGKTAKRGNGADGGRAQPRSCSRRAVDHGRRARGRGNPRYVVCRSRTSAQLLADATKKPGHRPAVSGDSGATVGVIRSPTGMDPDLRDGRPRRVGAVQHDQTRWKPLRVVSTCMFAMR